MFKSIIFAIIMIAFAILAENFFSHGSITQRDSEGRSRFVLVESVRTLSTEPGWSWARVLVPGLITGTVKYLAPRLSELIWLEWIFMIALIAVIIYHIYWWTQDGDMLRELIVFLPLVIMPFWPLKTVAEILASSLEPFWSSVVLLVPWFGLMSAGIPVISFLWERRDQFFRAMAVVLALALAIGAIALVANNVEWGSTPQLSGTGDGAAVTDASTEGGSTEGGWYHFYNTDLQYDNDENNNFNFGPNPIQNGWTAQNYDDDFRNRMSEDPALGAASIAWLDANVGTRYLGDFYESCKGDWAKTINMAKETWIENKELYFKNLAVFFSYLNMGKVSIESSGKNIQDQMYMNPYTTDQVPDIIVLKTDQNDGPFLVYTFTIKGNSFKVSYRIPCGYQPTNVKLVMGITPQSKPTGGTGSGGSSYKKTTTKASTPTTTKASTPTTTKASTPTTTKANEPTTKPTTTTTTKPTTTTKKYVKDPSKSSNSGKNDDPGPGPDTNGGVGWTRSTADRPTNSDHLASYEEYRQKIQELIDANKGSIKPIQNLPSVSLPSVKLDNPGAERANNPTPIVEKPSEIKSDKPAQAWDGPAD